MVVCAVKLCRNYTGKNNINPPEDISFHRFPTDSSQKQEWITAIRREPDWVPGTHCRVCSVHFDNSDFKISETGRRILHKDAIPTKNLYQEERQGVGMACKSLRKARKPASPELAAKRKAAVLTDLDIEGECQGVLACRACLATDTSLRDLHTHRLAQVLEDLTDTQISPTDGFPQHICNICCALLLKYDAFKSRCNAAQELMERARDQRHTITTDYIRNIDRTEHRLKLPLSVENLQVIDVNEITIKQEHLDFTMEDESIDFNNLDDAYDIFEDHSSEQKLFDDEVKLETVPTEKNHNEETHTQVYGTISPKHEIFVEVDTKKIMKHLSKKRKSDVKLKKKKTKESVVHKDGVRKTKPRKTNEEYDIFAKTYNVDIIFLSKEEQVAEVQARKESDNYKNSRFKCEECFKGFTGEGAFRNHLAVHDPSAGAHVCDACGSRFKARRQLLHHLTQHRMNLVCRLCAHVTKLLAKAKEHFKWHNGVKYPCHYCDKSFIKRTSQFNHMRNRHGSTSCDICQEIFSGERGLAAHMQKTHKEAVQSRCDTCGVQFYSAAALSRHLDAASGTCHAHLRACAECGDNFEGDEALNEHKKHTHWREIKCEKCNANFENEKLYKVHRIEHKEFRNRKPRSEKDAASKKSGKAAKAKPRGHDKIQKRMCEMCGLTWRSAAALKYHQRVHTGEKPHQCPVCSKSFRIQDSLQIHMNTHTGARPFKCPHCPKAFKSRTQNHKHQLVHTKVRRYRCELCDKTFQTSTCVKTHIRSVHMKIPAPPRHRAARPRPDGYPHTDKPME